MDSAGRPRWGNALAAYTLLFLVLFLQFPLRGRLPGNCDTWLNGIAIPNHMRARATALVTGSRAGSSFYPATDVLGLGESAIGVSALFGLFRVATDDDIVAYYLFISTVFALSALGVYLLAELFTSTWSAAFFAGLAFSCSNYILANIDSPHTSFFFIGFLALRELCRYLRDGGRARLLRAAVLAGLQVYFSAYLFLFLIGAMALVALAQRGAPRRLAADIPALLLAALAGVAVAVPFFAYYRAVMNGINFANPWNLIFLAELHSLEPQDLLRTLKGNRLWYLLGRVRARDLALVGDLLTRSGIVSLSDLTSDDARTVLGTLSTPGDVKYFVSTRRCAFLGLCLYGLAAVGAFKGRAMRRPLILMAVLFFLVALGPVFVVGESLVASPMYPAYALSRAAWLLRVPSRAFSMSVLAIALLAAQGLEVLLRHRRLAPPGLRRAFLAGVTLLALLENVPIPMPSFEGRAFARPDAAVSAYLALATPQVILDLPSRPGGALYRDSTDLFEWNREILYMNHQTYHRHDVINGVHGYFTRSRLQAQKLINALPDGAAFEGLRRMGVTLVVYHRDLELPEDAGLLDRLRGSPRLSVERETPRVVILRMLPAKSAG